MSQFALKLLALFAMLLDHTAKVVLSKGVLSPLIGIQASTLIQTAMISIGRMSFPIFAWFTAEGCRKSSNPKNYLLRMLAFAVLSEVPFQLCFDGAREAGIQFACHNVIFTLLLAAAAIYAGIWLQKYRVPNIPAKLIPAAAAIALGWFLHTDYNAWGVALVLALYYMPDEKGRLIFLSAWISVFQLIWHGWNGTALSWLTSSGSVLVLYWIGGMLSVLFLAAYSGKRGRGSKWLFYIFYPVHLGLLFLLAQAL